MTPIRRALALTALLCASVAGAALPGVAAAKSRHGRSHHHVTHHAAHHRAHHASGSIPQHNGGDRDRDNNGGASDGDGNI